MLAPMSDATSDAIVVRGLTKVFREKTAVAGLTFSVARGRFFGFLGPNGAGKSTTMRMLLGLIARRRDAPRCSTATSRATVWPCGRAPATWPATSSSTPS